MANELLKFKKGLYANLPTSHSAGTIYVTTDEKAMYVDIDNNTRIRLGETVHFASLNDFQDFLKGTKPPYNPQAFYYIDAENALLKWVPNGGTYNPDVNGDGTGDSNGTWKQINSTKAVMDEVNAIKERLATIETDQTTQNTNIKNNKDAIDRIDGEIGEADGSTEGSLWKAIKANKAAIESNDKDITDLQNDKLDKSTFEEYTPTVTKAFNDVNGKLGSSADTSNTKTAFERIEALETSNGNKAEKTDVQELNKTVYGSADRTLTNAGLVKKVEALETNSATKNELKEATDDIAEHNTLIGELRTDLGNTADAETVPSAFGRIAKLEKAIGTGTEESLGSRVNTIEEVLNGKGEEPGLIDDVADLQKALGDATDGKDKTTIYGKIAAIDAKDSEQDTALADINKAINGDANSDDQATKDGLAGRLTKVETKAENNALAIGTKADETSGATLWEAVKNAQTAAGNNAQVIGTKDTATTGTTLWEAVKNAQTTAGNNGTAITNINNEIGNEDGSEAGTLWNAIKTNATDIDALEQTIANEINAANGMTYKGGVSSAADVTGKTGVEVGDTYVATTYFELTQGTETKQVYAGDLLVASGTETNGVITENLNWTVVNTGYIQSHEATLGVATADKGAQINLNSYVSTLGGTPNSGDLGKIKIVSDNLVIAGTYDAATKTSQISFDIVWGDFNSAN